MTALAKENLQLVQRRALEGQVASASVFSVDVEEWFQVGAFENTLKREDWPHLESRVVQQTNIILEILSQAKVTATFFCLGWVAERHPALISQIASAGHEIGCHGMDHERIFRFSREEFLADIQRAKALLEDAAGQAVKGYRAPSFSMSKEVWGHYKMIEEAGFAYSSSIMPAKTDHYGSEGIPRVPFYPLKSSALIEVPMTVAAIGGKTVPASGGGYFRLLPQFVSEWLAKRAHNQTGIGAIFYMHPWELDPDQPFIANAPWLSRFRHYTGQKKMPGKIASLLARRPHMRMDMFLDRYFERPVENGR